MSPTSEEGVPSLCQRRARHAIGCLNHHLDGHHAMLGRHEGMVVGSGGLVSAVANFEDGEHLPGEEAREPRIELSLLPNEGWEGWLGVAVVASNGVDSFLTLVQIEGPNAGRAIWRGNEAARLLERRDDIRFHSPTA